MSLLSKQAFLARLVGKWQLCSSKSIFGTKDAGIEFTADGHWYKLDGTLGTGFTRETGFDHQGTWTPIDRSGPGSQQPWQLDFKIDGSGTIFTGPAFAVSVPKMRLDNYAILADYVRVDIPAGGPTWPDSVPSGYVQRAGAQAAFAIDVPKDWKGGWFEGVWDFEPKGFPSTSEGGNTFALTVTLEPGRYQDAFVGKQTSPITIEGRNAVTTSPDALHTLYAIEWTGCSNYATSCSSPTIQRLIIRLFASTQQLWDAYKMLGTRAALTLHGYDGSDPAHGLVTGGSKSNSYIRALTRFLDARAEGIGAEPFMCCSAPKNYQSIGGLYDLKGDDIVSYEAHVDSRPVAAPASMGFDVTIHLASGKTRAEFVTVGYESGQTSSTVAPKIRSACTGC